MESYNKLPFVIGFSHSAKFSGDLPTLYKSAVCSFVSLSGFPWYRSTTVHLTIHQLDI